VSAAIEPPKCEKTELNVSSNSLEAMSIRIDTRAFALFGTAMPRILVARIAPLLRQRLHDLGRLVRDTVRSGVHGRFPAPWRQQAAPRLAFVQIRREHDRA